MVDEVLAAITILEQNHHERGWPGELAGNPLDWFPVLRQLKPQADPNAEKAYAILRQVDAKLSARARKSWRWRQLYLRALLDAELKANGGSPNIPCKQAFAELIEIYRDPECQRLCSAPPIFGRGKVD